MILVTGATGTVGRKVVAELLRAGERVRALSRRPEQAGLPDDVEVVRGELDDPAALATALCGVDRVFLFPFPGKLGTFLDACLAQRTIGQIVLLSAAAIRLVPDGIIARTHSTHEQDVRDSGIPWTFVRPGGFMANDLGWAPMIKRGAPIRAPHGSSRSAPIDERDIAAVIGTVLRGEGHAGKTYELTGPESLSTLDRVGILGEALGHDIQFEEITPEAAREQMLAHGAPAQLTDAVAELNAAALLNPQTVLPSVQELTGNTHDYADWVQHHLAEFR